MLELAPAALREMAARRILMVRTRRERSIIEQRVSRNAESDVPPARGHPVAARRNANDQFVHSIEASAAGIASARSSAIICGPAISAARSCSQTGAQAAA